MDATREIYWNIGIGDIIPMYIITTLLAAVFTYGIVRRIRLYRRGRPVSRADRPLRRLLHMLVNAFAQRRVMRVPFPGITHAVLFWGMLLLFIGTLLIMVQVDFLEPLFGITFLKGAFYKAYSFTLDWAGVAAILTLAVFAVRRALLRPKGLQTGLDDYLTYIFLIAILTTGYVIEGARMAATEMKTDQALTAFSPVGRLVALSLSGMDEAALRSLHRGVWWIHFLLVTGWIAIIPFTKLRHMFATPAGSLLTDTRIKGASATPDLEAEGAVRFGAAQISDLAWKDLFDSDACMSCKRCQDRCPAWATGKPLTPMGVVQKVGEALSAPQDGVDLIELMTRDVLWACTTCRACVDICPAEIDHVNKIIEMRRDLVLMRGEFPGPEVASAMANLEMNYNPFGLPFASRGNWAEGLPVVNMAEGEQADILYFVGCYASFDRRNQQVARSFVKICDAAGIRVGILGKEERCCGEPPRKLGNEYLYRQLAAANIARIRETGVVRIVTACPHCFSTLGGDYRDLGFEMEVEHATVFVERLIREGAIRLDGKPFEATYHDSCHLARYRDIIDEPRSILRSAGGRITEMKKSKRETFCCGAGGGRILAEERIGTRINAARVGMAEATGAPMLVSSCPFCLTMFEDGIRSGGREDRLQARDLIELVAERLHHDESPHEEF
ncbi:MAG: heterodisulfide reductase-related iron-sulfur binding cluster [Acidobacteriota bacterium]